MNKTFIKQRGMVLALLGLMVSGCMSSSGNRATTASKMVTKADADRILGCSTRLVSERNGQADSLPGGSESRCEYIGPDRATLTVVIDTAPSEDGARGAFAESRAGLESYEHVQELNGVGDDAFLSEGPSSHRLIVRKKAIVFLLDARRENDEGPSVDEMVETAKRLADRQ